MLTIGQIADRAGINASAIRFYEREGLLPAPERSGGQRRYSEAALQRLQVIDIAKRAGFSLDEVRTLLDEPDRTRTLADRKLAEVEALIARAEAMRKWLLKARTCECSSLELCELFGDRSE